MAIESPNVPNSGRYGNILAAESSYVTQRLSFLQGLKTGPTLAAPLTTPDAHTPATLGVQPSGYITDAVGVLQGNLPATPFRGGWHGGWGLFLSHLFTFQRPSNPLNTPTHTSGG